MGRMESLLAALFPHKCFGCGELIEGTGYCCTACREKLLALTVSEACPRCGKPAGDCICAAFPDGFDRAAAPFLYHGPVRYGIHHYKYRHKRYYADFLSGFMAQVVKDRFGEIAFSGIVYVPMHWKKRNMRGFCPTKDLARGLSKRLGVPVAEHLLRHTGKGKAQMEQKTAAKRLENVRGAFEAVKGTKLDGGDYLLVDDVLTSGATAHRCACLLKGMGAGRVYVVTAATTGKES